MIRAPKSGYPRSRNRARICAQRPGAIAAARPKLTLPVPRMRLHDGPPLFSEHAKLPGATLPAAGYARLGEAARGRLAAFADKTAARVRPTE